ncbi:GNAT family N-acetyltransferase [Priestia koreensis]|uniref:GNAT family N-acetyltransferase n=1 Tax=Priestia koreensis TaxID=284581 RepID=UPI0028F746C4|nr:GNAT family N-acetyltransferase [Priestia koreensis]
MLKDLQTIFHEEMRVNAQAPGFRREESDHVVRHVSLTTDNSFIIASSLTEENVDTVIQAELKYFRSLNQSFEWKVYSYDQPNDLTDTLKEHGFTIGDPEALMVMPINEYKCPDTSITVQEITDKKGINDIIELENTVWNEPHQELGERLWHDKQVHPDSLFLYGIYDNEKLVSAAWMYIEMDSSFASLWGGSTLKEYRKQGHYSALLATRVQKARECGRSYLMVDASPMSRPILEKNGFHCLAYSYPCDSPSILK